MNKDRSWMNHGGMFDRIKPKYMSGVDGFLKFAFNGKERDVLKCPCMNCNLTLYHDRETMWEHLMVHGILSNYNPWVFHGESVHKSDIVDKYKEDALVIKIDSCSDDEMTLMDTSEGSLACDSNAPVDCEVGAQNNGNHATEDHGTGSSAEASGVALTYRQKRRLQSAKKKGPKRGPSRALKASSQRLKNPGIKPTANITDSMARIVGPNAGQFIAECSTWVKHYCPLNSRNWARMDATAKQALFDKIKEEWNLPTGPHVDQAVKKQCARLFRFWRYRLKERHFVGKSQNEALNDRPSEVDEATWRWLVVDYWGDNKIKEISSKNRKNRELQKKKSSNGALSTARILENQRSVPSASTSNEEPSEDGQASNPEPEPKPEPEPEPDADQATEHGNNDRITEHGKNNDQITEEEVDVCGLKDKKMSEDEANVFSLALQSELIERVIRLEQESAKREAALNEKIERMQAEALQREQAFREEVESLKAKAMEREKETTPQREDKLLHEVMGMKEQLGQLLGLFKSSSRD